MPQKTSKKLEEKVTGLIRDTNYALKKIGKEVGLSEYFIKNIQDREIKNGRLDEKYRRHANGVIKYQRDEVIELFKTTNYSLSGIGRKRGISPNAVKNIQDKMIKEGILDEKYRRLNKIVRYQQDKTIEFLKKTDYSLSKIAEEMELNGGTIKNIQERAIRKGVLDEKYKRLEGGIIKYQKDMTIELLEKSDYNLNEISKKMKLSDGAIRSIQDNAIKEGILDEKYRRLIGGIMKYQRDEVTELIKTTKYSLGEIGRKMGRDLQAVKRMQDKAIKDGILEEKYRRLRNGTVKYQRDEAIELLKTTDYSLNKIAKKVGLSRGYLKNIQEDAIKQGLLDERHKISHSQNNLEAVLRDYRGKEIA